MLAPFQIGVVIAVGSGRSVRGGFCGGMHSVLGNFVDASRRWFLMKSEQVIEGSCPLAGRIRFFDGFGDICFGENHSVPKMLASGELRRDGG